MYALPRRKILSNCEACQISVLQQQQQQIIHLKNGIKSPDESDRSERLDV